MTKLGHHLRDWREFRGLTQEQLASAIGVSRPYLSKIENGQNDYIQYLIERVAIVLKCSVADLIQTEPKKSDGHFSVSEEAAEFVFDSLMTVTMPEKRRPKKKVRTRADVK